MKKIANNAKKFAIVSLFLLATVIAEPAAAGNGSSADVFLGNAIDVISSIRNSAQASLGSFFGSITCFFGINCPDVSEIAAPVREQIPTADLPADGASLIKPDILPVSEAPSNQSPLINADSEKPGSMPVCSQICGSPEKIIQPVKETQTVIEHTNTVVVDEDTKNKVDQLMRQLDSDRPNYSVGQSVAVTSSPVLSTLDIGDSSFTVDNSGNVSANDIASRGNLTVQGNFTVSGAQTYSGAASFSANSTAPALAVAQSGSGLALLVDHLSMKDSTIATTGTGTNLLINPAGDLQFYNLNNSLSSAGNLTLAGSILSDGVGSNYFLGNVGIGTTGPLSKLHLNGVVGALSGGLAFGDGDSGLYELADDDFRLQTAGNDRLTITSLGNVGIGTTAPGGKLEIVGSADTAQLIVRANSTQSNTNPLIKLVNSSGSELLRLHADASDNVFLGNSSGNANTANGGWNGRANTFVGAAAGSSNTTGYMNTALGAQALDSNTTGAGNVAIGRYAMFANTTGLNNVAIGSSTFSANTTGYSNVAVGVGALGANTTGAYNTANGFSALSANTTATYNVASGMSALQYNTTGGSNIAMGSYALYNNATGGKNVGLGYYADFLVPSGAGTLNLSNATANLGVGTYRYKMTYVLTINGSSFETAPVTNATGIATTADNQEITITAIPTYSGPYTCTARKIYRTEVGGAVPYKLAGTISDNLTTFFVDSLADASLGAIVPSPNYAIILGSDTKAIKSSQFVMGSDTAPITEMWLGRGVYSATQNNVQLSASGRNGSNLAGSDLILSGGFGTGTGLGGNLVFKTTPASATSGTLANSLVEAMRINGAGNVGIGTVAPVDKLHLAGGHFALGPLSTTATGEIRFKELAANGTDYVGFKAPTSIAAAKIWTLPGVDGTNGQTLITNGAGVLSWSANAATGMSNPMTTIGDIIYGTTTANPSLPARLEIGTAGQCLVVTDGLPAWGSCAGSAAAAGVDGQIQFNNEGSFGANSSLVWDNAAKTFAISADTTGTQASLVLRNINSGNASANELQLGNDNATSTLAIWVNSSTFTGANNEASIFNRQDAGLSFGTNNTERMAIDNAGNIDISGTVKIAGNVGIGTTAPLAGLDVRGSRISSGSGATGINFAQTLVAGGNADVLNGLFINPTFNDGDFIDVNHNGLIVASGNVGIGTTMPLSILHLNGTLGDLSGGLAFGDGDTGLYESSDDNFRLQTAGNDRIAITSAGNVGIGTTAPRTTLSIASTPTAYVGNIMLKHMTADGDSAYNYISAWDSTENGTGTIGRMWWLGDGSQSNSDFTFKNDVSGANINLTTTGLGNVLVSNGNVGIGTTAPQYNLDVNGTINATAVLVNGVAVGTSASSGQWSNNNDAAISYSLGNVGIGTTAPLAPLHVVGKTRLYGSNDTFPSDLVEINATNESVAAHAAGLRATVSFNPSASNLAFRGIGSSVSSDASSERSMMLMRGLDSVAYHYGSGTVSELSGIMTQARGTGSGNVSNLYGGYFKQGTSTDFSGTVSNLYGARVSNEMGAGTINNSYGLYIDDVNQGSLSNYSIYSAGGQSYFADNVGIGTTSPLYNLDVNGTINANSILLNGVAVGTASGSQWASGAGGIVAYAGGNVGIGTVNPGSIFHIAANTTAGGIANFEQASGDIDAFDLNFKKARGTVSAPTVITTGDELGMIKFNGYSGAGGYVTGAAIKSVSEGTIATNRVPAHLSFWTGTDAAATVLTERMRINKSGYVGINTTAPLSLLSVNGGVAVGTYAAANVAPANGLIVSGNVGLGVALPLTNLHVKGAGQTAILAEAPANYNAYYAGSIGGTVYSYIGTVGVPNAFATGSIIGDLGFRSVNRNILFSTDDGTTAQMYLKNGGNVGIGTTSPAYRLDVMSSGANIARFAGTNSTGCTVSDGGVIACSSDQRLKKDVENLNYGINEIMSLRPVAFNWNGDSATTTKSFGFIAQEVETILPKLVNTDDNGFKELNTIGLVPVLAKAMQEQQGEINQLKLILGLDGSINATSTSDNIAFAGTGNGIANAIKNVLAFMGLVIDNGVASLRELVVGKVRMDKMEMVDQDTGEVYCTWIARGEWMKVKGSCVNVQNRLPVGAPQQNASEAGDSQAQAEIGQNVLPPVEQKTATSTVPAI